MSSSLKTGQANSDGVAYVRRFVQRICHFAASGNWTSFGGVYSYETE